MGWRTIFLAMVDGLWSLIIPPCPNHLSVLRYVCMARIFGLQVARKLHGEQSWSEIRKFQIPFRNHPILKCSVGTLTLSFNGTDPDVSDPISPSQNETVPRNYFYGYALRRYGCYPTGKRQHWISEIKGGIAQAAGIYFGKLAAGWIRMGNGRERLSDVALDRAHWMSFKTDESSAYNGYIDMAPMYCTGRNRVSLFNISEFFSSWTISCPTFLHFLFCPWPFSPGNVHRKTLLNSQFPLQFLAIALLRFFWHRILKFFEQKITRTTIIGVSMNQDFSFPFTTDNNIKINNT